MRDLIALQQRVADIMVHRMHLAPPPPGVDLFETGFLDSLSFVSLLVNIEEAFDMRIDLQELDLANFQSIAGIAAFIAERLPGPREVPEKETDRLLVPQLSWGCAG